jgi:isocitrate dehydrogenase kinase/phosphatase
MDGAANRPRPPERGSGEVPVRIDWSLVEGSQIESGLRIPSRGLRRRFREAHGELLEPEYWLAIQSELREGRVPTVVDYPEERRLRSREGDSRTFRALPARSMLD